uniref:Uncharacterized protein n=1 Tax=Arion vulgaris TaxID=1028688 RepID=A0A0B7AR66_9EUPU
MVEINDVPTINAWPQHGYIEIVAIFEDGKCMGLCNLLEYQSQDLIQTNIQILQG